MKLRDDFKFILLKKSWLEVEILNNQLKNINLKARLSDVWRPTEIFGCGSISVSLLNTEKGGFEVQEVDMYHFTYTKAMHSKLWSPLLSAVYPVIYTVDLLGYRT